MAKSWNEGAAIMDCRQIGRTIALAALIVSPTIVLLAMQMPLWLAPKQAALKRIAYANFGPPWIDRGPASWAVPVEANAVASGNRRRRGAVPNQ